MHMRGPAKRFGTGRVRSVIVVAALGAAAVVGVAPKARSVMPQRSRTTGLRQAGSGLWPSGRPP
ncbi:hypothetical protein QFZ56_000295 [Streptomyces achromogenes]|uniref:Uncharacterized protein n=1 Tax=Streptomyces achromogenes TaxID=67255 RepID=A0ABU0PSG4_STRAH|nr:hypothetical protein [Streptomyces achromogenes]